MPEAIPAVIGAGASIFAGSENADAAKEAAKAQRYAADLQQKRYETTRNDLMPYQTAGKNSLNLYGDATGANGQGAESAYYSNFRHDPGFQSGVDFGTDKINANHAVSAHGGLGGNQLTALQDWGQHSLYNEYHTRLDDLFKGGQLGENAAAQTGMIGNSSAQAQGNFAATAGQYDGKATAAMGQGVSNGINNLASYYYKNPGIGGTDANIGGEADYA